MDIELSLCWMLRDDQMRPIAGNELLRSSLGSGLVAAAAAPHSIERSIRLNFVHHKAAARAADANRDVVASLDPYAVSVVAPDEVRKVTRGLNGEFRFVLGAARIFARRVGFTR